MVDIYGLINRYIVYPLYYWKNSDPRLKYLKILEKNQYLSPPEIEKLQIKKLQVLIQHAYKHTVYYRKVMDDRKLAPNFLTTLDDLKQLPILTKSIIQDNLKDLISDNVDKNNLIKDASGGSTGEPTIYYKDLNRHNIRRADQIRHDRWSGWDIGKRSALIWGAQRDLKSIKSKKEHFISRYIARHWELDAFEMTNDKMHAFVSELEKIQPSMILGYANALNEFSEFVLKYHPKHKINLDGIISSAETLTEEKRVTIEQAFHCKVLNRYGSREVGLIASECKQQNGLHINADNIYVEVLSGESSVANGERGDLVVTDFLNFGMPFIRYKLEDVGYLSDSSCACGRTLPLLGAVEGRSGDFFVSKDNTLVHGEYFTHLFYNLKEVIKFQMIQHSLIYVELKIIKSTIYKDDEFIQVIIDKIKNILGEQTEVEIKFVDTIPKPKSGKSLFTISHVKPTNKVA